MIELTYLSQDHILVIFQMGDTLEIKTPPTGRGVQALPMPKGTGYHAKVLNQGFALNPPSIPSFPFLPQPLSMRKSFLCMLSLS